MSTKREPMLSDDNTEWIASQAQLQPLKRDAGRSQIIWAAQHVRDIYEAARDNDAELIQKLVNALHDSYPNHHEDAHSLYNDALDEAAAAGFKPSEP